MPTHYKNYKKSGKSLTKRKSRMTKKTKKSKKLNNRSLRKKVYRKKNQKGKGLGKKTVGLIPPPGISLGLLPLPKQKTIEEILKNASDSNHIQKLPDDIKIPTENLGKPIGAGANKTAYLLEGKSGKNYVLLTANNLMDNMVPEIENHIKLLSMYKNKARNFIIPQIYYSENFPDSYIIDYVKCKDKTHSKLCPINYCSFFGEFLRFSILECELKPYDVESCVVNEKLYLLDFGGFRPIRDKDNDLKYFINIYKKDKQNEEHNAAVLKGLESP